MSWQHVLATPQACLGNRTTHVLARKKRHVLASTPECLGNSTRQPPQLAFARTAACVGVNTSMSWQQHTASPNEQEHVLSNSPACLGTNSSMSWRQHQHVLAIARCLPSMSWNEREHVSATAPGGLPRTSWHELPSMSWHEHQHVRASTPECLGNSSRRPPQHVLPRNHTKPSMSGRQHWCSCQDMLGRLPGDMLVFVPRQAGEAAWCMLMLTPRPAGWCSWQEMLGRLPGAVAKTT